MPRDDDRDRRGRPPGRGSGRGGPPRGKGSFGDKRSARDERPREPRKPGGRAFRKAHGDASRSERGTDRPAGKRFGGVKSHERKFSDNRPFGNKRPAGDKRRFGAKPGGSVGTDRDRPGRAFDHSDRAPRKDFAGGKDAGAGRPWQKRSWQDRSGPARDGALSGDRPKLDRPKFDRPKFDRPKLDRSSEERGGRPIDGERQPRRFDRPKFDRSGGERSTGDRPRGEHSYRDKPRGDRPYDKSPRERDRNGERPRFQRDRSEHRGDDRSKPERPRNDRVSRSTHAWRDHPRSADAGAEPERRDDGAPRNDGRREVQRRPAFGGRGAYRERKPYASKDFRAKREAAEAPPKKSGERIAKMIARAGLCSRREAEEWIRQGRVVVNGRVIDSPALDINTRDIVTVDGVPLPERERTRLFLYHKPRGLVTTHADPEERPTIFDTLPKNLPRLVSVGRLDYNTEGLLLLTNDGGLKRALELPDTGWLRRYRVRAHGTITQDQLDALRDGVEVEGVKYGPIEATLDQDQGANVWITFAIREGKNREVRNVLSHLGLEVNRLIRVSYGPFQLGELGEGEVSEVRGRMLRDQLGERIGRQAGADFSLPLRDHQKDDAGTDRADDDRHLHPRREERREKPGRSEGKIKPRGRAGLISDGKGRRILVQRVGSEGRDHERRPPRPLRPYKGKREHEPRED
jgi:23S rRNA pseudouridine2605 synthase